MSSTSVRPFLILGTMMLLLAGMCWPADDAKEQSDIAKRIDASAKVLNEIMATPDKAIPDKIMSDAKCVAVIPSMVKIAVGFGGNHGKGPVGRRQIHINFSPLLCRSDIPLIIFQKPCGADERVEQ